MRAGPRRHDGGYVRVVTRNPLTMSSIGLMEATMLVANAGEAAIRWLAQSKAGFGEFHGGILQYV